MLLSYINYYVLVEQGCGSLASETKLRNASTFQFLFYINQLSIIAVQCYITFVLVLTVGMRHFWCI